MITHHFSILFRKISFDLEFEQELRFFYISCTRVTISIRFILSGFSGSGDPLYKGYDDWFTKRRNLIV